jgi:hypothetical protein
VQRGRSFDAAHAPFQPAKRQPLAADARSWTRASAVTSRLQEPRHAPVAAEATVPRPTTAMRRRADARPKTARIPLSPSIVTVHSASPVQAPSQRRNRLRSPASAASETLSPPAQASEQALGHAIPPVAAETDSPPVPPTISTLSRRSGIVVFASQGESWASHQLPACP